MPIHINLLAEAQAAEEMRRRDPVKRAIFIGASIVVVALMFGILLGARAFLEKGQITSVQTAIDAKTNTFQTAKDNLAKVATARGKLAALDRLQSARFLQGNLLNALQQATLDNVQLSHLRLEQSYTIIPPEAGKPGKASSREHIVLRLDARDFTAGDQVNKFKDVIARQSYLQSLLKQTNAVQLIGTPSAPMVDLGKPYVNFALECRFPEQIR